MQEQFSRTQFPNGGWEFYQPETNWWAPTPKGSTFGQTCDQILRMRLAHPAVGLRTKWHTTIEGVGLDLENYTRARIGLPPMGQDFPKIAPPAEMPHLAGAVAAAVGDVGKRAQGAAVLLEWEESGLPPEPAEVSEKRASICVNCPKNDRRRTLLEWITLWGSQLIRKRFERLHEMKLTTSYDAGLNVCLACECPMQLKVHTPGSLILKRLKPEQRADLNQDNPRCWILDLQ